MSSSQEPEVLNFVICDLCNYACSDKDELENHLRSHEENVKVETEVDTAGENVEDALEGDFETHEEITKVEAEAVLEAEYVEDAMEESFEDDQDRTKAKQNQNSRKNSVNKVFKRFKCDLCDYSSDYSSNVNKHKKTIHDKIRLQCEDCEYTTTNYGVLKKHMANVHNKEKHWGKRKHVASQFVEPQPKVTRQNLKCDLCNFSTSLERRLTEHMDEAHPEQIEELAFEPLPLPFKCNECEYAAAVESYLMNHKKMLHEIVKEKCDKCEFEGNVRAEMMTHKLLTHGEMI